MTQQTTPGTSRRNLICGLAATGLAGPLIAACGGGGEASTAVSPTEVAASEIPVGGGRIFGDEGFVVTQPAEGQFQAFSAVCTHQSCIVTSVEDALIKCSCHNSAFRIADGSVAAGPAPENLPAVPVSVEDDTLRVG